MRRLRQWWCGWWHGHPALTAIETQLQYRELHEVAIAFRHCARCGAAWYVAVQVDYPQQEAAEVQRAVALSLEPRRGARYLRGPIA